MSELGPENPFQKSSNPLDPTSEEMLAMVRECHEAYRKYPMWESLFSRCRDAIIEIMTETHVGALAAAAALYSIGLTQDDEDAERWLAVGWEMMLRMAARAGRMPTTLVNETAFADALESLDGRVLVGAIGGTWAIDQNGRLLDL